MSRKLRIRQATEKGYIEVPEGGVFDGTYATSLTRRGRVQGGATFRPPSPHRERFTAMKATLRIPMNTDNEGLAKTVLAGYFKYGCQTLLGDNYGTCGTILMEIYEESDTD